MHRRLIALLATVALLAAACGAVDQKVEEAAEEIVATSLAGTAIAQTLTAPTATPVVITATPAPVEDPAAPPSAEDPAAPPPAEDPAAPAEPVPTPSVDTTTMSEEELAAAIDAAVAEALAETEQATTATTTATADGTVTEDETMTVQVEVVGAEEALDEAEALIYAYYDLYGEYAEEAITVLEAIESDLSAIEEDIDYIASTLEQGVETVNSLQAELQAAATEAILDAAQAQVDSEDLLALLQSERDERIQEALALAPSEVATTRAEALLSTSTYIETVRGSLADGTISQSELSTIALAGANATASLDAQGGPQLEGFSGTIDGLTTLIARGDVPSASANLGGLEAQFQTLPQFEGPTLPEGVSLPDELPRPGN